MQDILTDDFLNRQMAVLKLKIDQYRSGRTDLNFFIHQVEALALVIGEEFWYEHVSSLCFDLEIINSDLIEKNRKLTSDEYKTVEETINKIIAVFNDALKINNN